MIINTISTTNESSGFPVSFLWSVDPKKKELFVHVFNTACGIKIHITEDVSGIDFFYSEILAILINETIRYQAQNKKNTISG